jgi:hypothetical protein
MEHRVAGPVGGGARALDRLLAEIRRVAAEWTLIERAVGIAIEGHSVCSRARRPPAAPVRHMNSIAS